MDILYALEKIRTPFWNGVMSAVTPTGRRGDLHCGGGGGVLVRQQMGGVLSDDHRFLRHGAEPVFEADLPGAEAVGADPNFTIVESARAEATGYSFPSGHTQNAIGLFAAWHGGADAGGCGWG